MTATFLVRGDDLPVLRPLAVAQATASDYPRALIWGVDLRYTQTRRAAKQQLRQACRDAYEDATGWSGIVHVVVVYTQGGSLPPGTCSFAASQAATRAHAEMERSRGRYVDVVVLDVTGWEDGHTLYERVIEAVSARPGAAGDAALAWWEILDSSIHEAAMRQRF